MISAHIDALNLYITQIEMFFNDTHISNGTAFFWSFNNEFFLITNWHNVSGKNNKTKKHLSRNGAEPNLIKFSYYPRETSRSKESLKLELYNNGAPVWFEHRKHGSNIDIVAIPLDLEGDSTFAINDLKQIDLKNSVSSDVFILGYPLNINTEGLPIWKRGSVASEPEVNVDGLPMFLVDTATAQGMSGAPVFRRGHSGELSNGNYLMYRQLGNRFVGIYSGRFIPDIGTEDRVQLGIVWKPHLIEEIVKNGKPGKASV